jgi:hypothetical protein
MIAGAQSETVQPKIGLFFSDTPPTHAPISVKLEAKGIDIPAGDANYASKTLRAPVDSNVEPQSPCPLPRQGDARTATLPDVRSRIAVDSLVDFRWQDRYSYRSPLIFPKGTRLSMRFTFDNSAENPANRNRPPQRVRSGPRSTDEMAQLWLEVVPRRAEDAALLNADFVRRSLLAAIASAELDVRLDPLVAAAHNMLATKYLQAGRVADAQAQLEEALRLDPRDAEAHSNLGVVLQAQGRLADGMEHLRTAARLKPKNDSVRFNLVLALQWGSPPDTRVRTAIASIQNADAHFNLG